MSTPERIQQFRKELLSLALIGTFDSRYSLPKELYWYIASINNVILCATQDMPGFRPEVTFVYRPKSFWETELQGSYPNAEIIDVKEMELTVTRSNPRFCTGHWPQVRWIVMNGPDLHRFLNGTEPRLDTLSRRFPCLRHMVCRNLGNTAELNISSDTLEFLGCGSNQLTQLRVTAPRLRKLFCELNQLTLIDLNLENLETLDFRGNPVARIRINCPNLRSINFDVPTLLNASFDEIYCPNLETIGDISVRRIMFLYCIELVIFFVDCVRTYKWARGQDYYYRNETRPAFIYRSRLFHFAMKGKTWRSFIITWQLFALIILVFLYLSW